MCLEVECLTRDRRAACRASPEALRCFPEQDTYPLPRTGLTQEDPSRHDIKFVDWVLKRKKYPQHTFGLYLSTLPMWVPRGKLSPCRTQKGNM